MWRDPLDELIDDLDRVAPDPSETLGAFPFATIQAIVDAVLYGTPAEVEAYMADPMYQRWAEQHAERLKSSEQRFVASGLASLDRTVRTQGGP